MRVLNLICIPPCNRSDISAAVAGTPRLLGDLPDRAHTEPRAATGNRTQWRCHAGQRLSNIATERFPNRTDGRVLTGVED